MPKATYSETYTFSDRPGEYKLVKKSPAKMPKKKQKYKIRNWKEYNESLVKRYDINIWIKKGWVELWEEDPVTGKRKRKKRGGQTKYTSNSIECLLTIKYLFKLPYRGVEGLAHSLLPMLFDRHVNIPDYTTIQRRNKNIALTIRQSKYKRKKAIDLILDSTGFKVYGEGEWVVRMHGKSKQRTWKKIHLAINRKTLDIEALEVTNNSCGESQMVKPLLNQVEVPINKIIADGGYDSEYAYNMFLKKSDNILIPVRHDARYWTKKEGVNQKHPRDETVRVTRLLSKSGWKKEVGYHERSLVETEIYRLKRIFGDVLSTRTLEHQKAEVAIKCRMLNKINRLGMPDSYIFAS